MKQLAAITTVTFLCLLGLGAQSVTLAWNANTETNLAGYRLYHGTATRSYSTNVAVAHPATTVTVTNLQAGTTYFFAVTAYTTEGLESDYSDEVSYLVPRPPTKPANLRVVVELQSASLLEGPWTNQVSMSAVFPCESTVGFYRSRMTATIE